MPLRCQQGGPSQFGHNGLVVEQFHPGSDASVWKIASLCISVFFSRISKERFRFRIGFWKNEKRFGLFQFCIRFLEKKKVPTVQFPVPGRVLRQPESE